MHYEVLKCKNTLLIINMNLWYQQVLSHSFKKKESCFSLFMMQFDIKEELELGVYAFVRGACNEVTN